MKHLTNILLAFMLTLCITAIAVAQVVTTDKPDYEPGETVIYSGFGFEPDEVVNLVASGNTNGSVVYAQVTADGDGSISGSFVIPLMYEEMYTLVATGGTSNLSASTTFLDTFDRWDRVLPTHSAAWQTECGTSVTFEAVAQTKPPKNDPVSGVQYTITVTGGTLSVTSGTTGADGLATTSWTAPSGPHLSTYLLTIDGGGKYVFWNLTINCPPSNPSDPCENDTEAPVPNAETLEDVIAQCSADLPTAPTATDNCAGQVTGVADVTGPFGQGDHMITWTYTDAVGNFSTQTQWVKVHDTEAPVVSAPGDITFPVCGPFDLGSASAVDNCDGDLIPTNDAHSPFPLGQTVVTWSATDATGNTGTAAQNVTVNYGAVNGFLPPLTISARPLQVKKGSTIPVKFQLVDCPTYALVDADILVSETVFGKFRWTGSQYIFNLDTKPAMFVIGSTYTITANLADKQTITVDFAITK